MRNSVPARGFCPECIGEFLVVSRTGDKIGTLAASDLLEWECSACGHRENEVRRLADGYPESWPNSRFNVFVTALARGRK